MRKELFWNESLRQSELGKDAREAESALCFGKEHKLARHVKVINTYMLRIKRGDTLAFNIFYKETNRLFRFVAMRYLKNAQDLDDIVQEAYILIVQNIDRFEPGFNGLNWAYTIVKNLALKNNEHRDRYELCELTDLNNKLDYRDCESDFFLGELRAMLTESEMRLVNYVMLQGYTLREVEKITGRSKSALQRDVDLVKDKLIELLSDR